MSMGVSVEDAMVLAMEIPGYSFHASMAFFIGWQICHKSRSFDSAFFMLFLAISIADIIYYLICSIINIKLPQFGLWTDFYVNTSQGWVSTIGYMTGEYCGIFQALSHFVISLNRFNVFYFPNTFDKNWQGKRFHITLSLLLIIPFCCILWHSNHKILYYYVTPTSIAQAVDDKGIQLAISIMGLTIFSVSSILELGLGVATLIKYRRLSETGQISSQQKAAVILFLHSLCITCAQLLRTVFHGSIITAMLTSNLALASFMQKRLPLIADIYALTGSIFLFIISKKVRSSYLNFYSTLLHLPSRKNRQVSAITGLQKSTAAAPTISHQKDTLF